MKDLFTYCSWLLTFVSIELCGGIQGRSSSCQLATVSQVSKMHLSWTTGPMVCLESGLQLLQTDQEIATCFTSPETQELFKIALQSAKQTIRAIHDACQRRCDNGRKGSIARFQWAILDRKTVNRLLTELQKTEDSLKTVLQFLSLYKTCSFVVAY
jgi:hypothetical protein